MHLSGSSVGWHGRLLQYAVLPFVAIALFACQGSEPLGPEPNPAPQLESVDPASIPIGGATSITASGSDFDSSSVVRWEGEDRPTTYVSPWELRAFLEEDDVAGEGEYAVTVWNPEPGGGESGAARVEVTLSGTVEGRIAVDGEGIPGVEVRLVGADDISRGESTEDGGEFRFHGLPKGTYTLDFELPRISRIAFADSAKTVELATDTSKARAEFEGAIVEDFPETERAVVRGSVRDENGDPLAMVGISLRMAGSSEASPYARALELPGTETASIQTDSDGRYEVEVPAGDVEVEARAPDRAEDDWLRSFEALDWDGAGEKWVDDLSVSAGDTATADFAWISCIAGTLDFGEEIETELTSEDCVHAGFKVREVWTFDGREGELVDLVTEEVWCSPLILLGPERNEVEKDWHGCAGGELWISTTLSRDGTYYLVVISDIALAADDGVVEDRRLFVDRTSPWSAVVAGGRHSCGISPEGRAWCWGDNAAGQLGDGTRDGSATPVAVVGDHTFESLSAGAAYTCGVTTGGDLYCWGENADGQLGDGTTTPRFRPARVVAGRAFEEVSASLTGAHTCAVDAEGAAWCWGANGSGQLGNGSTAGAKRPVRIAADARFREIAPGGAHTCALTDGGAPLCWGANDRGQLGNGTTESSGTPQRVSGELSAGAVAAGDQHSCVLDPDAPLDESSHCWGRNDATGEDRIVPVKVVYGGLSYTDGDASWLAAGGDRTCAVIDHTERFDRTYCWEPGWSGPAGWTGGWTEYASVSVGGEGTEGHICAVLLSGSAHCWGANGSGQLGRGTFEDSEKPRPVAPRPEETLHALTTGSRPSP